MFGYRLVLNIYLSVFLGVLFLITPSRTNSQSIIETIRHEKYDVDSDLDYDPFTLNRGVNLRNIGPAGGSKQVLDLNPEFSKSILTQREEKIKLQLPLHSEKVSIKLKEVEVLSEVFILRNSLGNIIPLKEKGRFFWGVVEGDQNSVVVFNVFADEVNAMIQTRGRTFTLGKIRGGESYLLYEEKDIEDSEPKSCFTDNVKNYIEREFRQEPELRAPNPNNCVQMYFEVDFDVYNNFGNINDTYNYILSAFSQVILLYDNESINMNISEVKIWDTNTDPYTGPSTGDFMNQLMAEVGSSFNGDLAHLVGTKGNGGIAYVNVLCNKNFGVGYSDINMTYANVPTYSWTVEVLTHEIGHNLGSPHTHDCVWNGNNTQIDDCGSKAGDVQSCYNASNEIIPAKGTIMSYCHLIGGVGIDFNLGFGPQPGDLIRSRVYNAACLTECGTCEIAGNPCDDGDPCTINDKYDTYCNCSGDVVQNNGNVDCVDCEITSISIFTDNYPQETSWTITNSSGSVIASSPTYSSSGDQGLYYICLENGCFNFNIYDSYGDGICCAYGAGSFEIKDFAGNVLGSGGAFGSSQTIQFCYEASASCVAGTTCDDGDPCTENDIYDADCGCAGTLIDADQDGICDNNDPCYDPMVIYLDQNIASGVYNAREQIILNPGATVRRNANIILKAPFIKIMDDVTIPSNASIQIDNTPCQN